MVPTHDRDSQVSVEATKMDQSWTDIVGDKQSAMPLAPPAPFDEDYEDGYASYSAIVDAPTTPSLLPQSALPAALPVRPNVGTAPPPRTKSEARSSTDLQVSEYESGAQHLEGWTRPHWPSKPIARPSRADSVKRRRYIVVAWVGAALATGVGAAFLAAL